MIPALSKLRRRPANQTAKVSAVKPSLEQQPAAKNQNKDSLEQYFADAESWDKEIFANISLSRNRAWLVAFFPVLSNTAQGLRSTDHNLLNLFELYGASRWQTLMHLRLPNALPYFLAGLRIAGGLALIAAVVAEFAAGTPGANAGLAFRLIEAQHRLNIPRLFAALVLLSLTGVAIYGITSVISWLLLRKWHESAVRREN